MPGGEWIRELLESLGWGAGATHIALYKACPRCNDTGQVGPELLPLPCPLCYPVDGLFNA